jgi:hypothetical protein
MGPGISPGIEMSVTKRPFAEAGRSLEMLLGLRLRTRTLKHMSRGVVRLGVVARGMAGMRRAELHAQALVA